MTQVLTFTFYMHSHNLANRIPSLQEIAQKTNETAGNSTTTAIDRVVQAGAHPVTWVALAVELQRDWAREETVQQVIEIVLTERLLKE